MYVSLPLVKELPPAAMSNSIYSFNQKLATIAPIAPNLDCLGYILRLETDLDDRTDTKELAHTIVISRQNIFCDTHVPSTYRDSSRLRCKFIIFFLPYIRNHGMI